MILQMGSLQPAEHRQIKVQVLNICCQKCPCSPVWKADITWSGTVLPKEGLGGNSSMYINTWREGERGWGQAHLSPAQWQYRRPQAKMSHINIRKHLPWVTAQVSQGGYWVSINNWSYSKFIFMWSWVTTGSRRTCMMRGLTRWPPEVSSMLWFSDILWKPQYFKQR